MHHWILQHFNNQVGGQGPEDQDSEMKHLFGISLQMPCVEGAWGSRASRGTTQPTAWQGRSPAGVNKSRRGSCSGTRAHHQSLSWWIFWAVTCRGSRSNWDLLWLGQQQALYFYQKSFTGSNAEQNCQLAMCFKVSGWHGSGLTFFFFGACVRFLFLTDHWSEQTLMIKVAWKTNHPVFF